MAKVKYIDSKYVDATGHEYKIIALDCASIHKRDGNLFVSARLVRYKDHKAKVEGKKPAMDSIEPVILYASELQITPLMLHNAVIEDIASKEGLEVIEFDEDVTSQSPIKTGDK
jgi:hypothetical protein